MYVPQGGALSPIPTSLLQLINRANYITSTDTHSNIQYRQQEHPYNHTFTASNTNKSMCTIFTPNPAEYNTKLNYSNQQNYTGQVQKQHTQTLQTKHTTIVTVDTYLSINRLIQATIPSIIQQKHP